MLEQHISTKQVCRLLGISLSTFYRYCKAGILKPAFLTFGGHRRFSLSLLRQSFNLDNNAVLTISYSHGFIYYNFSYEYKDKFVQSVDKVLPTKIQRKEAGGDIGLNNLLSIFVNDLDTKSLIVSGSELIAIYSNSVNYYGNGAILLKLKVITSLILY